VTPTGGTEDETKLVRLAQSGDREAFLKLIEPYHRRVHATAVRLLGNTEDATEVTQEAILRTFWKIHSFRGQAHFYTWLYRTALNLCYRRMSDPSAKIANRQVSLDAPREDEEGAAREVALPARGSSPRDEVIGSEELAILRQALGSLHPRDFEILVLREFEELSYEEIAKRLKLPAGTITSKLHRARTALAKRLKELGVI